MRNPVRVLLPGDGVDRSKAISSSTIEKVSEIKKKAEHLIRDANLLFESASHDTALSLSVLAIEECGKAFIILWTEQGKLETAKLKNYLLSHNCKQRVYTSYLFAKKVMDQVKEDFDNLFTGQVPYLVWDNLLEKIGQADYSAPLQQALLTEIGFQEKAKQSGFYVEVEDVADVPSFSLSKSAVEIAIGNSRGALSMFEAPEEVLAAAAEIFKRGPQYKFGPNKTQKLKDFIELVDKFQNLRDSEK